MNYVIIPARRSPGVGQIGIPGRIHGRGSVASVGKYAVGRISARIAANGIPLAARWKSGWRVATLVSVLAIATSSVAIGPEGSIIVGGIGSRVGQIAGQAVVIDSGIRQRAVGQSLPIPIPDRIPVRIPTVAISVRIAIWGIPFRIAIPVGAGAWVTISVSAGAWVAISVGEGAWIALPIPFPVAIPIAIGTTRRRVAI